MEKVIRHMVTWLCSKDHTEIYLPGVPGDFMSSVTLNVWLFSTYSVMAKDESYLCRAVPLMKR